MNYEQRIRDAYPTFSKSFARLADFVLDSYLEAAFMTATELGHAINVDATTVVRFSQQLGYAGYPELLREIRNKIKSQLLSQQERSASLDSIDGVIQTAMDEFDNIFEQTRQLLDSKTVETLVGLIGDARRIVLLPDKHGESAAHTLLSSLESGGFNVTVVEDDIFDLARSVRLVENGDFYIAFQSVQESDRIAGALKAAREAGAETAAILSAASFSSAQEAGTSLFAYAQHSSDLSAMILNAIAYTVGQALRWQYPDKYAGSMKSINQIATEIIRHGAQ